MKNLVKFAGICTFILLITGCATKQNNSLPTNKTLNQKQAYTATEKYNSQTPIQFGHDKANSKSLLPDNKIPFTMWKQHDEEAAWATCYAVQTYLAVGAKDYSEAASKQLSAQAKLSSISLLMANFRANVDPSMSLKEVNRAWKNAIENKNAMNNIALKGLGEIFEQSINDKNTNALNVLTDTHSDCEKNSEYSMKYAEMYRAIRKPEYLKKL